MTQKHLLPLIAAAIALPTAAFAQITVVDFGTSDTYVTGNQNLAGGNGAYTGTNISPASGYAGPTFWGGVVGGMSTWELANNYADTGNFDAIRGRQSSAAANTPFIYVAMFSGSQNFTIDNTANSSFYLNGRKTNGSNIAGVTGVRWLLQDTSNNYFISALNSSTNAQFGNAYASNPGVTGSSLVGLDWFSYTFNTGSIGSAVADEAAFFGNTTFKSAGFYYVNQRTANGAIDTSFADFSVTAIPEPSAFAAVAGLAGLGLAATRRRRRA